MIFKGGSRETYTRKTMSQEVQEGRSKSCPGRVIKYFGKGEIGVAQLRNEITAK